MAIIEKSSQNNSRGVIELLKDFVFQWMCMNFSDFLLWVVNLIIMISTPSLYMTQLARKNSFQQLKIN